MGEEDCSVLKYLQVIRGVTRWRVGVFIKYIMGEEDCSVLKFFQVIRGVTIWRVGVFIKFIMGEEDCSVLKYLQVIRGVTLGGGALYKVYHGSRIFFCAKISYSGKRYWQVKWGRILDKGYFYIYWQGAKKISLVKITDLCYK